MKRGFEGLSGKIWSNAAVLFAVMLLLFPSSPSVLCIAPGSHVAIEDLNALCCVSSGISLLSSEQPDNGFNGPGTCTNCTDLFLVSNGRGMLRQSGNLIAANPFEAECLEACLPSDISASLSRSCAIDSLDAPIPFHSSVPLRC